MMHDLALMAIPASIASLVCWRLGYDSGKRDERQRIGRHLLKIRREQGVDR